MRRLLAVFCAALLLCAGCASQSKPAALSPEEFMAYPADGEPLSPADAQGEITIGKSGVSLGFQSAPSDAYASADFSSKRSWPRLTRICASMSSTARARISR